MRTSKHSTWLGLYAFILPLVMVSLLLAGIKHAAAQVALSPQGSSSGNEWTPRPQADQPEFAPDRVIVRFKFALQPARQPSGNIQSGHASLDALFDRYAVQALSPLFDYASQAELSGIYLLLLPKSSDVLKAVEVFQSDPNVAWAEPDYLARRASAQATPLMLTPNDPLLAGQWGLDKIQAADAWDIVTGTQTVVIAVLDSGIDRAHIDLAGKLWVNPGEIAGNGIDDDSNGYVDDVHGWDFANGDNDPSDDNGHGTQAAGIAAAIANNNQGIAGVCWNCEIMPVKVMPFSGEVYYSHVISGVLYAAHNGARVINLSLGGYGESMALQAAIREAVNSYNAVVVCAAGNDNLSAEFFPAAYTETLAVAGTTDADGKAFLSNYGSWVDVSAPAINITTTFLGGDWGPVNGTSAAASYVSGLAGLLLSQHPDWSPKLAKAHIKHTIDDIDAGLLGSGRINAAKAVGTDPQPILRLDSITVNGDPHDRPIPGKTTSLEVTLGNEWYDASNVTGTLSSTDTSVIIEQDVASFGDIPAASTATGNSPFAFTVPEYYTVGRNIPFSLDIHTNDGLYSTTLTLTLATRSHEEPVSGTIVTNTLWTNNKTYLIQSNLFVTEGVTLTIQPGTQVHFSGTYDLIVSGTLIADGSQAQPIHFRHSSGSSWGGIHYRDSAVDAQSDVNGAYQRGNLLRWVQIEDASQGVSCDASTPYLAQLSLDAGGVNCTPGVTPLWLQDNTITGSVIISGIGQVLRNTIADGSLNVSGQAIVEDNLVVGGITVGSNSLVQGNTAGGTIVISRTSVIKQNTVTGGGIHGDDLAVIWDNDIIGGEISAGMTASVMSNTLSGGGITIRDGSIVHRNNIEYASDWGISTSGNVTLTYNRVVTCGNGISLTGGLMHNNLVANNLGFGLQISGNSTIISNTFTGNLSNTIQLVSATSLLIQGNNWEGNKGMYDIENRIPKDKLLMIPVQYNWWGTTDNVAINARIFDRNDGELNVGEIIYSPKASSPRQSAPVYLRSVSIEPTNPVDIGETSFKVEFSRPMDTSILPELSFQNPLHNSWLVYTTSNSGLPDNHVQAIAIDPDGSAWFGTMGGGAAMFDGTGWVTYTTANSKLPDNDVWDIAIDSEGAAWFSVWGEGVVKLDGTEWTTYTASNSGLLDNVVWDIAVDPTGKAWFGTNSGVASFDGTSWMTYTTANSDLPNNIVWDVAFDSAGATWFGTLNGAARLHGTSWITYTTANSSLPANIVWDIAFDAQGNTWFVTNGGAARYSNDNVWTVYNTANSALPANDIRVVVCDSNNSIWFGTTGGAAKFDGAYWTVYNTANSALPANYIRAIAVRSDNIIWFGTNGGVAKFHKYPAYTIQTNTRWLDNIHYQGSYEFDILFPQDTYLLTVQDAVGLDNILMSPNTSITFTVVYTSGINDITPPPLPDVIACSSTSSDTLSAYWIAHDPESEITLYSYAIGSSPGGEEIVHWTKTISTSLQLNDLDLIDGQTYYISVKARNQAGLWSLAGASNGVEAGAGVCPVADFLVDAASGVAPHTVQFSNLSTGTLHSWVWDFGEGITSSLESPTNTYMQPGVYTVSLRVTGPSGVDIETKADYIMVHTPVVADFSASPITGLAPLVVTFSNASTGSMDSWLWDFGDGVTSTQQLPTHEYSGPGVYTITLQTSGPGGLDTVTKARYITVRTQVFLPIVQTSGTGSQTAPTAIAPDNRNWMARLVVFLSHWLNSPG